jgi:hypothetical protein
MRIRKIVTTGLVASGLVLFGAGNAWAASPTFNHSTTGGRFTGNYQFLPTGVSRGGFHFWGLLDDTTRDSNAMKVEVRVVGYPAKKYYAPRDADKYMDYTLTDPQATRVDYARAKVCRDRGSLLADNCSTEITYRR